MTSHMPLGRAACHLRPLAAVVATIAGFALITGCSGRGGVEDRAVATVARTFVAAAGSDPADACAQLAPATLEEVESDGERCADVVGEAGSEWATAAVESTVPEVYGRDALVRLGDEVLFLSRFDDGWRVTAAGCAPRGTNLPYDCDIEGR